MQKDGKIHPIASRLLRAEELKQRISSLHSLQQPCRVCPRRCLVTREDDDVGICQAPIELKISGAFAHIGEEPELVGRYGSGTIFLSHCNLRCVFCQNFEISHFGEGHLISSEDMATLMIRLQNLGCHNINFVTPTHYVPQIVSSIEIALEKGLSITLVYNCSGYESLETLKLLYGIIDIYMPDFKFASKESGDRYADAPDYFDVASEALLEMHRQVGDLVVDNGIAKRGLLIRHLVLPGLQNESKKIMHLIASKVSRESYVNIMAQYHPSHLATRYPGLGRRVHYDEVIEVKDYARQLGLHRGF